MACMKHSDAGKQQENKEEQNVPDEKLRAFVEDMALQDRMSQIKHKIMVLSGKGGVGKSTVAVNIAVALAVEGKKVGILDADFHGPSIPTLLHLNGKSLKAGENGIEPIAFVEGVKVISIGFFMQEQDKAVIWRGPMKISVIKQLLAEVNWGELDYLIIDFPPGTGDEPLSVAQLIPEADGAIIVTTPQDLSLIDVRKSIDFCRQLKLPVLGVIENMSGLVCPHCEQVIDVFKRGGGEKMAAEMGVPFLGRIPIEPLIVEASDSGKPFIYHYGETKAAQAFNKAVQPLLGMKPRP
jgi:ATP-binding protein involved in chromosome partitioning